MCGPLRGAICGAIVFEGWATDLLAAAEAGGGRRLFDFEPNHHFDAVGPMTGMTTRSQPVLVVENRSFRQSRLLHHQRGPGQGHALRRQRRRGAARAWPGCATCWDPRWAGPCGPATASRLKPIIARGLAMGDEMHQRNVACYGLVSARRLAPSLARTFEDPRRSPRSWPSSPRTTSSSSTSPWRWARR